MTVAQARRRQALIATLDTGALIVFATHLEDLRASGPNWAGTLYLIDGELNARWAADAEVIAS